MRISPRIYIWSAAAIILIVGFITFYPVIFRPHLPVVNLTIQTADGRKFPYYVEVPATPEQFEHGLMFRLSLPANSGMIFMLDREQPVNFWMKNTAFSLDMLFVRGNGEIAHIATHTTPFSTDYIPSVGPVRAVIEINAGEVDRYNIKVGDKVVFPTLGSP